MNEFLNFMKTKYVWVLSGLLVVVVLGIGIYSIATKDEVVKCDNSKALKILKEKNIADLAEAADNFLVKKDGDNYTIAFGDSLTEEDQWCEFAKLYELGNESDIKAEYDTSKAMVESVDKDINEVVCIVPVTFSGFSMTDKKSTLAGKVLYTIHANGRKNIEVDAASLKGMFRSNFKPIYNARKNQYLNFVYTAGNGEIVNKINEMPEDEFGDFFSFSDY